MPKVPTNTDQEAHTQHDIRVCICFINSVIDKKKKKCCDTVLSVQKTFILTYDEYYNHMSNLKPQMKYPKSLKKKGGGVGRQGDKRSHTYTHYVAHILKCLFRVYTLQKDFLCTHVEGREGGKGC